MTQLQENRTGVRRSYSQLVSYGLIAEGINTVKHVQNEGLCVDISDDGMGLLTENALHKGQVIEVYLPANKTMIKLPVFAEVVWSTPVVDNFRSGLKFLK